MGAWCNMHAQFLPRTALAWRLWYIAALVCLSVGRVPGTPQAFLATCPASAGSPYG